MLSVFILHPIYYFVYIAFGFFLARYLLVMKSAIYALISDTQDYPVLNSNNHKEPRGYTFINNKIHLHNQHIKPM